MIFRHQSRRSEAVWKGNHWNRQTFFLFVALFWYDDDHNHDYYDDDDKNGYDFVGTYVYQCSCEEHGWCKKIEKTLFINVKVFRSFQEDKYKNKY